MSPTPGTLARLATAVVAALFLPTTATAADDDEVTVVVENAGDQANAITLPAPVQVGQRGQVTIGVAMDLDAEGVGMSTAVGVGLQMTVTSVATEVTADGGHVSLVTLDNATVTELPEGASASEFPCVGVTGVQVEETYDAAGSSVSLEPVGSVLGPAEQACVDQLVATQSQTTVVYPDVPVGPGASWSADIVVENQGIEVPVTYHYSLTDVSDGRFTIETTLDSDFEAEQDGYVWTGRMSGSGRSSGAVANAMDASSSFKVNMAMASDIDGEEMTMSVDMSIDVVSVVPPS